MDPAPQCLFFDVFGTCVDWRTSVTNALEKAASEALEVKSSRIPEEVRSKATAMTREDWGGIAEKWRQSYLQFTRAVATNPDHVWKTVDEHYFDAVHEILESYGLVELTTPSSTTTSPSKQTGETVHPTSLFTTQQLQHLNHIWHHLDPWTDTNAGLTAFNNLGLKTCTLTNGNVALITEMVDYAKMPFTDIYSAEMFRSYKPSPKVYLGAAARMGLEPNQCVMVAAHLEDLEAAKSHGMRTVYVERPREERREDLRDKGIADVWVSMEEDGFVTAAERLGEMMGSRA